MTILDIKKGKKVKSEARVPTLSSDRIVHGHLNLSRPLSYDFHLTMIYHGFGEYSHNDLVPYMRGSHLYK